MQRLINIICFLFFFTLSLSAQNISVASFSLDESDLTANLQGTTVLDQNGEKCALIRIQTTQTGFSFDVGSLGVSKVVQKTGEIWVYVPFGVKRMTLRHQLLGTTEYVFPMGVEKARTYKMQLTTGEVQTIVKNAVTSQYVLFRVTPKNAVVEIDGQMIETVDGTATKRMPFGTYGYRVQAPRHAPEVGNITVSDAKNKHVVTVGLVPQFTNVTFNVAGNAEIWIDNQRKGVGSCTLELGYGTYLVECRKQGHRASQQEVAVSKENASQPVRLKSPTPIYGSLDINSTPADAEVWIDGKQAGTSPMFISECLIGSHEVKLKKQGYKDKTLSVSVTEGQTASLMETMEKGVQAVASSSSSLASSSSGNTFTVNGVSFEMIPVEGGTFRMGSTGSDAYDDEKPVHSVTLSSYAIGKTEVTQALWKAVMGSNPSNFKGDNLPVENVSWNDCQDFIRKLNQLTGMQFRLPTEAEWEYAARGGNRSRGYKYSGGNDIGSVAWYNGNSGSKTHPVGTKQSNELGIYDMSGNVWEWCQDWYGKYSSSAHTNPTGASSGSSRVRRGGSWGDYARDCRSSLRYNYAPDLRFRDLGLRLALSQ